MSTTLLVHEPKTLFAICDDLCTYTETLEMLEGKLAQSLEDQERSDLTQELVEVSQAIQNIGAELSHKTDAVAAVLRRIGNERDVIDAERTRLRARGAACDRADKWLRGYVLSVMRNQGMTQLKTATNTLFIRGSEAVEITDASLVPDIYQNAEVKLPLCLWNKMKSMLSGWSEVRAEMDVLRVKAEPSLSTIKKAIKSGVEIPGADVRLKDNLVVR